MNSHVAFPRELKIWRCIFGLGSGTGLFLLLLGLLALYVGNVLKFFSEDPGSLTWTFNYLAYGVFGTFVSIRVFELLPNQDISSPRLIVLCVLWLALGEIILGLVSNVHSGAFFDHLSNQIQNVALWLFFYVLVSSQFRFLKVVHNYYGALAPLSRLAWMNQLEQWILRTMGLEQARNDFVIPTKS